MSEAFAELQNRDEMNRQLKAHVGEDERLHTERMNSILHQGQAETAGVRPLLVQEGRTVEGYYEAQADTPLTEMTSDRMKSNDVTVQYPTATQPRDAVATTAQMDMDSHRTARFPGTCQFFFLEK